MSDETVVRGVLLGWDYEPKREIPFVYRIGSQNYIPFGVIESTILIHKDGRVGEFEPWMVEFLNDPFEKRHIPQSIVTRWMAEETKQSVEIYAKRLIAQAIQALFDEGG